MDKDVRLSLEREEKQRKSRIKELEEMVQRLQSENKKLLNQMVPGSDESKESSNHASPKLDEPRTVKIQGTVASSRVDSVTEDVLNLTEIEEEERSEDVWLYVSPVRPPTPQDKSVTPNEWVKEGEASKANGNLGIPGLEEVKKQLLYYAMDLELHSPKNQNLLSPDSSPKAGTNLRRVQSLSNKTAQKYLEQVRIKRRSLDRGDASPTMEEGDPLSAAEGCNSQSDPPTVMKSLAVNPELRPSPSASNSLSLKPRNMPIRAIIPPGKAPRDDSQRDNSQEQATPPSHDSMQERTRSPNYRVQDVVATPSPNYVQEKATPTRDRFERTTSPRDHMSASPRDHINTPPHDSKQERIVPPKTNTSPDYVESSPHKAAATGGVSHRRTPPGGGGGAQRLQLQRSPQMSPRGIPGAATTTHTTTQSSLRPPTHGSGPTTKLSPLQQLSQGGGARPPPRSAATGVPQLGEGQMGKPVFQQQQTSPHHQQHQGLIAQPVTSRETTIGRPAQQKPAHRGPLLRQPSPRRNDVAGSDDASWMEGCF